MGRGRGHRAGNMALTHGWQAFARARGLHGRCTLHFKYDDLATLYMRVFRVNGRRAGCCPEEGSSDDELGLDDGRDDNEGELALGDDRASPSVGGSSGESTSSGDYDQPPRRRALMGGGDGASRRRAPMKREEDSG